MISRRGQGRESCVRRDQTLAEAGSIVGRTHVPNAMASRPASSRRVWIIGRRLQAAADWINRPRSARRSRSARSIRARSGRMPGEFTGRFQEVAGMKLGELFRLAISGPSFRNTWILATGQVGSISIAGTQVGCHGNRASLDGLSTLHSGIVLGSWQAGQRSFGLAAGSPHCPSLAALTPIADMRRCPTGKSGRNREHRFCIT